MKRRALWLSIAGLALAGLVRAENDDGSATIEEFDVPEYDDQGIMTSRLKGDTARVMTNGFIEVHGLSMEFYKAGSTNHEVDMRVSSPECLLNKDKKAAVSDKDVRIARDNMIVTGTGFMWNNNEQLLMILTNSRVVLMGIRRNMDTDKELP